LTETPAWVSVFNLPTIVIRSLFLLSFLLMPSVSAFTHFEPRQQHPITLTPDGKTLLALHSTAHSLSVFDVGTPPRSTPLLIGEIPLSSAPVSVKARTNDEIWIANEAADSISIISLSKGVIIDTLRVADEPIDICFANNKAFITCSQKRVISIFHATTRASLGQIALDGITPRALVASNDGSKLYVACLYSGNRTTILSEYLAPAQPNPTNPLLPAPPQVGLIVSATDSRINWNVLDHDIAEINTTTHAIDRWISRVGTHLFDLAMHPDGSLWCVNSDSLNLTRFEPELNGHVSQHRLSRIALPATTVSHFDLNPGITRATTPHAPSIALALSQPTGVILNGDGSRAWITAFSSDRVAEVDTTSGAILRRVDLRPAGAGTEAMRGPRHLVMGNNRLYVLNKISDTLATIDPTAGSLLSDIPLGSIDPMPRAIRQGRGFLYDARLSGNGTISCATCHIDADRDGLAWDLGDPGGSMVTVVAAALAGHSQTLINKQLHPMKGPLITQTLRGLATNDANAVDTATGTTNPPAAVATKFHWRGDKPSIQSFNTTFPNLMGGTLIPNARMDQLTEYLRSIVHHPNPNRNLNRTLRSDLPEGNAVSGLTLFNDHAKSHCIVCHDYNSGTNQNIDDHESVEKLQPIKNPPLRTVYQRAGLFQPTAGANSLSGFGLGSDGTGSVMPIVHPYSLDILDEPPLTSKKLADLANLTAFLLSYDTNTAPAASFDLTLNPSTKSNSTLLTQLGTLESQAALGSSTLVAWGQVGAKKRKFSWSGATSRYVPDDNTTPLTRTALLALITGTDSLTFAGILISESTWRGLDRNANGISDQLETAPQATIQRDGTRLQLHWPQRDWYPESSPNLLPPWQPALGDLELDGTVWKMTLPTETQPSQFYRLRRTW
jgi:DNA-binding beta-propeller fold protein YncE